MLYFFSNPCQIGNKMAGRGGDIIRNKERFATGCQKSILKAKVDFNKNNHRHKESYIKRSMWEIYSIDKSNQYNVFFFQEVIFLVAVLLTYKDNGDKR